MGASEQTVVEFGGQFNTVHMAAGKHLLVIPLPDEVAVLMGRIAVQWGAFEERMDMIVGTTLAGYGRDEKGWKQRSFRKRSKLYKDLMVEYSTTYCPNETAALRAVAADASQLHWRRNIVVHGIVEIHGDGSGAHQPAARFTAHGSHNGKMVALPLDVETLSKLWHDIAHLGGALMMAYFRMGGALVPGKSQELIVADADLLQGPQSGSFRTVPIPERNPLPPGPPPAKVQAPWWAHTWRILKRFFHTIQKVTGLSRSSNN